MVLYFAARYGRREELVGYKEKLEKTGIYTVNSRWLSGTHELGPDMLPKITRAMAQDSGKSLTDTRVEVRDRMLQTDLQDVMAADGLVCFSEDTNSPYGRGGRHVEFGIALGYNLTAQQRGRYYHKRLIVVGPHENLFHYQHDVLQFPDWEMFYNFATGEDHGSLRVR